MSFSVRLATSDDAPFISQLCQRVYRTIYWPLPPEDELALVLEDGYGTKTVLHDMADASKQMFVAVRKQQSTTMAGHQLDGASEDVLGVLLLAKQTDFPALDKIPTNSDRKIEVERVYIDVAEQGIGVGKLLMEHAESVAREQKRNLLWLCVWIENRKAQQFYTKLNYHKIGEWDFGEQRDCIMVKDL